MRRHWSTDSFRRRGSLTVGFRVVGTLGHRDIHIHPELLVSVSAFLKIGSGVEGLEFRVTSPRCFDSFLGSGNACPFDGGILQS